jgi:hypothetical protein
MTTPSIASRLEKRLILMTADAGLEQAFRAVLPEDWRLVCTLDLESLGGFQDVLQYRFLFLDLESLSDAFDPLDAIRLIRQEWMLNLAIFCIGGSEDERDEARLSRADRFFSRDEALTMLPRYCEQYRW